MAVLKVLEKAVEGINKYIESMDGITDEMKTSIDVIFKDLDELFLRLNSINDYLRPISVMRDNMKLINEEKAKTNCDKEKIVLEMMRMNETLQEIMDIADRIHGNEAPIIKPLRLNFHDLYMFIAYGDNPAYHEGITGEMKSAIDETFRYLRTFNSSLNGRYSESKNVIRQTMLLINIEKGKIGYYKGNITNEMKKIYVALQNILKISNELSDGMVPTINYQIGNIQRLYSLIAGSEL